MLRDGIVRNQVNPQSGQSFNEANTVNHWATLHFRKDQNGKIYDFYTDSLNANSTSLLGYIESKLSTLGIEAGNINKIKIK